MNLQEEIFMSRFILDNNSSAGITPEKYEEIKKVVDKYKVDHISDGTSIIDGDFGILGSIVVRQLQEVNLDEPVMIKFEEGMFVSITTSQVRKVLWTDYKNIEPYNRQGGLYADGASFESLGDPIIEKDDYRVYDRTIVYNGHISFGLPNNRYNEFWKSVKIGTVVKNEDVDAFIKEILELQYIFLDQKK